MTITGLGPIAAQASIYTTATDGKVDDAGLRALLRIDKDPNSVENYIFNSHLVIALRISEHSNWRLVRTLAK
jgi:hypothetical protein